MIDIRDIRFADLYAIAGPVYACAELRRKFRCPKRLEFDDARAARFFPGMGLLEGLASDVEVPAIFTGAASMGERPAR